MNLSTLIKETADMARNQGVTISAQSHLSMVAIDWPDGDGAFMQGQDADAFNNAARDLWAKSGDVSLEDCELFLAMPYVECLS